MADTKTLSIVQWSHFVPNTTNGSTTSPRTGARRTRFRSRSIISRSRTSLRARPPRSVAGSGHDLFGWNGAGGAHLYRKFLIDVGDLVKSVEKKYGKVSIIGQQLGYNQDDGTWSAFPDYYINFPGMYRKSMWDEIGMKPDTWDNLRIGGAKLKAKGNPVGIVTVTATILTRRGAACCGAMAHPIQDEHGKQIVLDGEEAVEAVKYAAALYKEAMTSDVLSSNNSSNNQYINSGVSYLHHQPDLGVSDRPEAQ